jgi:hypothetical protein
MMKMAPLARALAADFSIQPLAFSLSEALVDRPCHT